MSLLTSADYDSVRAALDALLDCETLPDDVIALDLYAGAAERAVLARDPLAETRTGSALARVRAAAVLYAASYLAPVVPQLTSERFADYSYSRNGQDWAKLAASLRARADAELDTVLETRRSAGALGVFTVARGRRGR